eukprot:188781_1
MFHLLCVIASLISSILALKQDNYHFGCNKFTEYDSIEQFKQLNPTKLASTLSKRVNMTNAANNDGAVCIDGSVPVFYWRPGKDDGLNKFVIYFDGGGWCDGLKEKVSYPCQDSCVHRATSQFGTSTGYAQYMNTDTGCMSTDSSINPLSYNWNVVLVKYCDGSSYNSNNETTVTVGDLTLHFRGWRILNGLFKQLQAEYKLKSATDVVVGGCSAGGLNLYMHIDYIGNTYIPSTANFVGLIDSGFFMQYEGKGKYMTAMQWLWDNMNMTQGLNQKCIQYYKNDPFQCMFAENLAPFIDVKVFSMQSRFDEWQQICELVSENTQEMNEYGNNLTSVYEKMYENANGNSNAASLHGVFLDSCTRHCDDGGWYGISIDGYSQATALYEFYNGQNNHSRIWFQNKTYPCTTCCKQ